MACLVNFQMETMQPWYNWGTLLCTVRTVLSFEFLDSHIRWLCRLRRWPYCYLKTTLKRNDLKESGEMRYFRTKFGRNMLVENFWKPIHEVNHNNLCFYGSREIILWRRLVENSLDLPGTGCDPNVCWKILNFELSKFSTARPNLA